MVVNIQLDFRLCSKRLSYRIYSMVPGLSPVTILLTPITGYLKKAFIYLFATVTRHIYPRERTNVYSLCSLDILIILSACHLAKKNPLFPFITELWFPLDMRVLTSELHFWINVNEMARGPPKAYVYLSYIGIGISVNDQFKQANYSFCNYIPKWQRGTSWNRHLYTTKCLLSHTLRSISVPNSLPRC